VLTELWFVSTSDNRFAAVGGDCYIAAVEFSDPVRAMVLTVYGNATQPGSNPGDEQLMLFSRKQLRPALLERTQILEHLAHRELLDRGRPPS
jgi:acyl-homoserine-lactone acylase